MRGTARVSKESRSGAVRRGRRWVFVRLLGCVAYVDVGEGETRVGVVLVSRIDGLANVEEIVVRFDKAAEGCNEGGVELLVRDDAFDERD